MSLIDAMLKSMMMKRVHDTDDETVAAEERIAGKTRNRPTYGVRRGTPAPDYSRHRQGAPEGRKKPERGATPNISSPRRVPTPKGVPPDASGVSSWEEAELRHRRMTQEDEQDTWDKYRGLRPTYHYDPDDDSFNPGSSDYWSPDDDLAESIMDDKYDKTYGWYDPKQTMPDKKHPRGKWNYNPGADKEGPSQASAIDTLAGTGTVEDRPSVQGLEEPKGRGGKGRSAGPMTTLSMEKDASDYVKKPNIQNSAIYKMLDRLFKADPNRIDAGRQRGAAVQQGIRDTALRGASEVSQGGGNEAQGIGQGIADSLGWAVASTVEEGKKDTTIQAMSDAIKDGEQARLGQPPYKPWAQGQAGQGFGWMNWNQ